jgi:hypothetical protein
MEPPYLDSGFLTKEDKTDIIQALAELSLLNDQRIVFYKHPESNERFFSMTYLFLKYEGSLDKKSQILAFAKAWGDFGYNTIAKALFVRVQEAMDIESEQKKTR